MNANRKCRANGGVSNCTDPKCPERKASEVQFQLPTEFKEAIKQRSAANKQLEIPSGWNNDDTHLLKTIHGSTLYGLNHAESDEDYYIVVPSRYVGRQVRRQSIVDGIDSVVVDFKSFTRMAELGAPQALEAMFSQSTVSEYFEPYRTRYFAASSDVVHRYLRTIKAFVLNDREDHLKMKRHALRLSYNLEEILYTGRFNPTLPKNVVEKIFTYSEKRFPEYVKELNAFTPLEIDWGESLQNKLSRESE